MRKKFWVCILPFIASSMLLLSGGGCGSSGSESVSPTPTPTVAPTAPTISQSPQDQTVNVGQKATFTVTATGTAPLAYQWKKDGVVIRGATSATYTIASTVVGDSGTYTVMVTNATNFATSQGAVLTVNTTSAMPDINNVSGSLQGPTITISGSGFGTKNPVAPLKFDAFDEGGNGTELISHDSKWQSYSGDGHGLLYSNSTVHAGSMALRRHVTNGENFITNYFTFSPASQELFVSYWFKIAVNDPAGHTIVKMTRLSSSKAAGGGGVYNGAGGTTLGGTYDLANLDAGPYCAYTAKADGSDETPLTGDWNTNYFGAPPRNAWYKIDCYKKLSTPGFADGVIDYRLNTEQKTNHAAMTRAAGASFLMDTVLLGGMDGSDANHDYYVYIDDVYIDNTRARVEICDAPHWADRAHGEIQIPVTLWTDSTLQIRINQGSFPAGSTQYLYVVNKDGVANPQGYPITFP